MKLVAVFFVLGTAAVLNIPEIPTASGMLFLLIATLASIFLLQTVIPGGLLSNNAVSWALVAFLLGIGNGWYVAKTELSHKLDASLHGIDVELIVQIDSVPVQGDELSRFRCRVVKTVDVPPGFTPKRLQVTWYDPDELVAAGDTWRFRLRVKPPRGLMNPGGFDYAGWLFEQRVHALAYVREAPLNQRLATDQSLVSALRQEVRDNLLANSQGLHHTGLMQALVVGLRTDVPDAVWSLLRRTGTSHLLAISGLHIGLAATWGFLLGTALVRVFSSFGLQLNRLDVGGLVAFTVASGYSVLAGLTVPTRRALVMLLLYMLLVFTRRHGLKSTPFFIAMLVLVALDPLTILSPGFWLSFGAVGSLLYLTLGRVSAVGSHSARILQVLKVHTALAALLFPLTALFSVRLQSFLRWLI